MSHAFSGSVQTLVQRVNESIFSNDLDNALKLVHDFVERIITEPVCTAQVFSSKTLDELCLKIGLKNFNSIYEWPTDPCPYWNPGSRVVYLATRVQRSGGHSRLIHDFIKAQPEKNHLLILTDIAGPSDLIYYENMFSGADNVRFMVSPRGNLIRRLNWVQKILKAFNPGHVHLFNHHQDSVAVSALVPELGLTGTFYHHGDHHLCLGVHYTHLRHIDFHPMGYHYCRDNLGVNNEYLPLTFKDLGFSKSVDVSIPDKLLTTATVARSNKVEIPYYVSYLETIALVLKATGGRHIHIGKLTPWAIRRIRAEMKKHGVSNDRLIYIEWTDSVWKSLQRLKVDVYLASFPYGAGLTLIEAMGAGVPVIMHQHMYSRVLSGLELAYPEAFSWSDPKDLFDYLGKLNFEDINQERQLARLQFLKFHNSNILDLFFSKSQIYNMDVPPLVANYSPRMDEWASWVEHQINFGRLIYKHSYRNFRLVRNFLNNLI